MTPGIPLRRLLLGALGLLAACGQHSSRPVYAIPPASGNSCDPLSPDGTIRRVQKSRAFAQAVSGAWVSGRWRGTEAMMVSIMCASPRVYHAEIWGGSVVITRTPGEWGSLIALFAVEGRNVVLLNRMNGDTLESGFDLNQWNGFIHQRRALTITRTSAGPFGCAVARLASGGWEGPECDGNAGVTIDSTPEGNWIFRWGEHQSTFAPNGTILSTNARP